MDEGFISSVWGRPHGVARTFAWRAGIRARFPLKKPLRKAAFLSTVNYLFFIRFPARHCPVSHYLLDGRFRKPLSVSSW